MSRARSYMIPALTALIVALLVNVACALPSWAEARSGGEPGVVRAKLLSDGTLIASSTITHTEYNAEALIVEKFAITSDFDGWMAASSVFKSETGKGNSGGIASKPESLNAIEQALKARNAAEAATEPEDAKDDEGEKNDEVAKDEGGNDEEADGEAVPEPVAITIDSVSVKKRGETDSQVYEEFEFDPEVLETLGQPESDMGEGWMYDPQTQSLYVLGSFTGSVDVTVEYHVDGLLKFGDDVAYLSWCYLKNDGTDGVGRAEMVLALPEPASEASGAAEGFVFAEDINAATVLDNSNEVSDKNVAAFFAGDEVVVRTSTAFPTVLYGNKLPAKHLLLNLVMDRSRFDEDASGVQVAGLTAAGVIAQNKTYSSKITTDRVAQARQKEQKEQRERQNQRYNTSSGQNTGQYDQMMSQGAYAMTGLCAVLFLVVLALTAYEYYYMHRRDPKANVLVHTTSAIPDKTLHPLVFDDLFHHEFDPEPEDLETELLRLAATGAIEVRDYVTANGKKSFSVSRGENPLVPTLHGVDAAAMGLLFPPKSADAMELEYLKKQLTNNPARTKKLFEEWKTKIKEQADKTGYAQQRIPGVTKAAALASTAYTMVAAAVAGFFEAWWLIAFGLASIWLLGFIRRDMKRRIVLTESGVRLKAQGDGLCNWLSLVPPEQIADTDDPLELADRLTYLSVFARDTWGPEKVAGVVDCDKENPRLQSVDAVYCRPCGNASGVRNTVAHEIVDAVNEACKEAKNVSQEEKEGKKES